MKKWYQSKTVWVNIISLLLEIINIFMDSPIIPVKYAGLFTIAVNVLNILLRFITTSIIDFNGGGNVTVNEVDFLPSNPTDNNQWYWMGGTTYYWWNGATWQSEEFIGHRPPKPPHN